MSERLTFFGFAVPSRGFQVLRYRTEVLIPADRYVFLQLPEDFPEGRALVTLYLLASDGQVLSRDDTSRDDPDRDIDDVEWWEEFEEA